MSLFVFPLKTVLNGRTQDLSRGERYMGNFFLYEIYIPSFDPMDFQCRRQFTIKIFTIQLVKMTYCTWLEYCGLYLTF